MRGVPGEYIRGWRRCGTAKPACAGWDEGSVRVCAAFCRQGRRYKRGGVVWVGWDEGGGFWCGALVERGDVDGGAEADGYDYAVRGF